MNSKPNSVITNTKIALLGFAFLLPLQSNAGTSTAAITVSTTVLTACVVSATALTFADYDTSAAASAIMATSDIGVTCTGVTPYTLALGSGAGSGATVAGRKLTGPTQMIDYNMYSDSNYMTIWGDGTSGTSTVGGTSMLGVKNHTVFGKIPAGQMVDQGVYIDVVTVNLTY